MWIPPTWQLLAHRVISLYCGTRSLSGHSGHRSSRTNLARLMSARPIARQRSRAGSHEGIGVTASSAARWPSRSATAAGARSRTTRTPAALPAPGRETAARCPLAACRPCQTARQTTTPPVSLNFAKFSHGVRSGAASRNRWGRPASSEIRVASCASPVTARSGWLVRRSKLSPKKFAIAVPGSDVATSPLPVQGRKSVAAKYPERRRDDRGRPDRAQQTLMPQLNDIAGRDDQGQARHHQGDARSAGDAIEIEQAGDQACHERGANGEEIDEIARQRIDRRPIDGRRLFRVALEPAGVEHQPAARYRILPAAGRRARRPSAAPLRSNPRPPANAARPRRRRGSAKSDMATPARRSPAARTADRTTSACAARARSRAQIRPAAATGRSRLRSSAAKVRLRWTMRTTRCACSGR